MGAIVGPAGGDDDYVRGSRRRPVAPVRSAPMAVATNRGRAGPLIRERRIEARRSLLDLALDVGVSTRHLGFVELGRSRPSPELVTLIGDRLGVSRREQNTWLLAAGYAPRHAETPLDAASMASVRRSLQAMLDAHEPFPAVAVDRCWTAQLWNEAALWLAHGVPTHARGDPTNMFRISLHPDGFASRTRNLAQWSGYLLRQLDTIVRRTRSAEATALAAEIEQYPDIPPQAEWSRWTADAADPVLPWVLERAGVELSLFSVMATLGTPVDITLTEMTIELFLPADEATAAQLQHR
jgi:transcriptional regulator with XRE-family HTH domain